MFIEDKKGIVDISAREILDSRGMPTIEVDVSLEDKSVGRASVPAGASTGIHEAWELRDGDPKRFNGKGVLTAIGHIHGEIYDTLRGMNALDQTRIDQVLIALDGTENKSRLGANAVLGVSLATAKAAAISVGMAGYRYLGGTFVQSLPLPLINILNGGRHADTPLSIQEFMIVPIGFESFSEALRAAGAVFESLKAALAQDGHATGVGDEGGFAPALSDPRQALDYLVRAIDACGLRPGADVGLALDAAASSFCRQGRYLFQQQTLDSDRMIDYWSTLLETYPILSLEDGLAEDDWNGWKALTQTLGDRLQLVGDDLFVTHSGRLLRGVWEGVANAIVIKPNQIGTLSETVSTLIQAREAGYQTVLSHRSGETEDPFLADLAVGLGCSQIKAGSVTRSERVAKYNQLLRIEESLGSRAKLFSAEKVFRGLEIKSSPL